MRIMSFRTVQGPSVYHHRPTIIMTVDLGDYAEKASTDLHGFSERLVKFLPELENHFCSPGYKGGFIERLNRGTYPAHIIEHISLALSELAGIGVHFGKTVYLGPDGVYNVIVRFKSEKAMKHLLKSAVELFLAVAENKELSLDEIIDEAKYLHRLESFGSSTEAVIQAAEKRNIPWQRMDEDSFVQLGTGKYRKFIQATTTSNTGDIGVCIAQDKNLTKQFLRNASIKVPRGYVVRNEEDLIKYFDEMDGMVTVKPADGNHGRGVSLKLKTHEEVISAFRFARAHSDNVIIEEFFNGLDFRVLVVDGKMIAAAQRIPANVTGDGKHTINELIEIENQNPMRGQGHEKPLTSIEVDEEAKFYLHKSGISLSAIPEAGKVIYLRETANLSTGGVAVDVTDIVHPEIRLMCERAALITGLDVCGIDLIIDDISRPLSEQNGGIIEVNAGPGIRMHLYPAKGTPRDVGGAIIDSLFKEKRDGRIPVISITGTNGKTTVTRLVAHVLHETNLKVGSTTTDGIYIGKNIIAEGDTTGPVSAKTILNDPTVEIAVLETARGGIVRRGLGYDWSDVGVITNIQPDHIGQDGIETLDDILWVKSLVAERVKKDGTIILNADSKELREFIKRRSDLLKEGRRLMLFSMKDHMQGIELLGERDLLFYHKDGSIFEYFHGKATKIADVKDIPITMNGTAVFQVENVLAGIAALRAADIPTEQIIKGLKSFQNRDNPGRLNLYRVKNGFMLLDYGHNPDAFLSVGLMMRSWGCEKITAVIGTPGDRSDDMIRFSGTAASQVFDKIIVREDDDRRGRAHGEVSSLIKEAIQKENYKGELIIVNDSVDAFHAAIKNMLEKEAVVYFYEDRGLILNELQKVGAGVMDHLNYQKQELNLHG